MKTISPLRYPGGKTALADIIEHKIKTAGSDHYAEPFAGGAGAGLCLLINGHIKTLCLNDKDPAIYSIWQCILNDTDRFIKFIETVPIDINEYQRQKQHYANGINNNLPSFELGCAAFFLNRTNVSGVITGGPIGGYNQSGKYKLDCRFGRKKLIEKTELVAKHRSNIRIYNCDAIEFIDSHISPDTFLYIDPPYMQKAKDLYRKSFDVNDHKRLHDKLLQINNPWLLSYDDNPAIRDIYTDCIVWPVYLLHSAANNGRKQELLIERVT